MKRAITFIIIFTASLLFVFWGQNPGITYAGIIIAGFLGLALFAYMIKSLWKLIGKSFTSAIFILLIAVIAYTLSWHGIISGVITYTAGIFIGTGLTLLLVRWIARFAHNSTLFGELFSFLTGYKVKAFVVRQNIMPKEDMEIEKADHANIILILKQQMGYTAKEAKLRADHAIEETLAGDPLEDKILKAIQYHGRN